MTALSAPRARVAPIMRHALAPLCLAASLLTFFELAPGELEPTNLKNLLAQCSPLAIVALGQMVVLVTRGFDISVGSVTALSAVMGALAIRAFGAAGIVAAPLAGLACGLISGSLIGRLGVQPVIATLAMLSIARGLALLISGDRAVILHDGNPLSALGYDDVLGVPAAFVLALAFAALLAGFLRRAAAGRRIYMLGSNPAGAEMVGVAPRFTLAWAYGIAGLSAGVAATILVGRAGGGLPTDGQGFELQAIAAAVIGGVSLAGGVGRPWLVLVGALFIESLSNGLTLAGYSQFLQEIILGAVILLAGLADHLIRRAAASQRLKEAIDA